MKGVPLLNFEGGPGVSLLNFEGDPARSCVSVSWSHFYIMPIQSYELYICKINFTPDQIYIYLTRKIFKESALSTLNLPQESAGSTTKPRPVNAFEQREEYQRQDQMSQTAGNAYRLFEDFTSHI